MRESSTFYNIYLQPKQHSITSSSAWLTLRQPSLPNRSVIHIRQRAYSLKVVEENEEDMEDMEDEEWTQNPTKGTQREEQSGRDKRLTLHQLQDGQPQKRRVQIS